MNRQEASFLLLLVFLACAAGFGTSVTNPETEVLALVFGLLAILVGAIICSKCLRPFGQDGGKSKEILQEVANHLRLMGNINPRHEATGERVGSLTLSAEEGSLWRRLTAVLGEGPDSVWDTKRK